MAAAKRTVHCGAVEPVDPTLLAWPERKIPAHNRPGRQQLRPEHIRTKMHMVMAVDTFRFGPVESVKFLQLFFYDILEAASESGVKHYLLGRDWQQKP